MADPRESLERLLEEVPVASLAVVGEEGPAVSLVPWVRTKGPTRLWILVSELSAHTAALRKSPRAGVMVSEAYREGDPRSNHALKPGDADRGRALPWGRKRPGRGGGGAVSGEVPDRETLLGLGDFHWVELSPVGAAAS
nr:pyridoxamine 5'-phosphate oxidase family protein [Deltaproteobacteria bacterium]